jgi:hypothetical protein
MMRVTRVGLQIIGVSVMLNRQDDKYMWRGLQRRLIVLKGIPRKLLVSASFSELCQSECECSNKGTFTQYMQDGREL